MNLADWFRREFALIEHATESVIHSAEKEITMAVPQSFADAIARLKALLSSHSDQSAADAQTIATLNGQVADLKKQLDDCKALDAQKDATIADLNTQLSDAKSQIADMEAAVLGLAPAN